MNDEKTRAKLAAIIGDDLADEVMAELENREKAAGEAAGDVRMAYKSGSGTRQVLRVVLAPDAKRELEEKSQLTVYFSLEERERVKQLAAAGGVYESDLVRSVIAALDLPATLAAMKSARLSRTLVMDGQKMTLAEQSAAILASRPDTKSPELEAMRGKTLAEQAETIKGRRPRRQGSGG